MHDSSEARMKEPERYHKGGGPKRRETQSRILLLATTSADKVRETKSVLGDLPLRLVTLQDIGLELTVPETGSTFLDNARIKAEAYHRATGLMVLAEDAGLEVDALGGEPGVRSARWAGTSDYTVVNRMLLDRLKQVPWERRTARYVSAMVLVEEDGSQHEFTGTCEGYIALEPRGTGGFGYDPIFYVPEYGKTMAELSEEEKNRISHRGKAARQVREYLLARLRQSAAQRQD